MRREKSLQGILLIENVNTLINLKKNRRNLKALFDNYNTNVLNVSIVQNLRRPKNVNIKNSY